MLKSEIQIKPTKIAEMQNKIDAIKNAVKPTIKDTVPEPVTEEMYVAGGVPANVAEGSNGADNDDETTKSPE